MPDASPGARPAAPAASRVPHRSSGTRRRSGPRRSRCRRCIRTCRCVHPRCRAGDHGRSTRNSAVAPAFRADMHAGRPARGGPSTAPAARTKRFYGSPSRSPHQAVATSTISERQAGRSRHPEAPYPPLPRRSNDRACRPATVLRTSLAPGSRTAIRNPWHLVRPLPPRGKRRPAPVPPPREGARLRKIPRIGVAASPFWRDNTTAVPGMTLIRSAALRARSPASP